MSIPAYASYRKSEVEWIRDLPGHWTVQKFKRVLREREERSADGSEELLSVSAYTGVTPRSEIVDDGDHLSRAKTLEGYKVCYPNDLVMNIMLAWNRGLGFSSLRGIVSPAYCVFKVVDDSLPAFMNYLVRSNEYIGYFKSFSAGVIDSRLRLYPDVFGQLSCVLPPLGEQRAIAAFLDRETGKIDALVYEQRQLIELLKEKRQAVISHAVTKGLDPAARTKNSRVEWLGEVPEHWTILKLGRAAFMQEGPGLRTWQFTPDGIRVICVTNITESGVDFSRLEKFISADEYDTSYRHFTVNKGDILLSSSGNSWGKVAVYEQADEVILNTSTIRLNELRDIVMDRAYIPMFLQSTAARDQLELAMTGACQPNFGPTHLSSVMVAVPPLLEQRAIVDHLRAATAKLDDLSAEVERAISLLNERRSALISAAVTGHIDVRGLGTAEAEAA